MMSYFRVRRFCTSEKVSNSVAMPNFYLPQTNNLLHCLFKKGKIFSSSIVIKKNFFSDVLVLRLTKKSFKRIATYITVQMLSIFWG